MPAHTIGLWMYHNGGGAAIEQQLAAALKDRNIEMISGLNLYHATAQNGSIMCHGVRMESLDLYLSYNAGQQSTYQVYLYKMLNKSVPCINSFEAFSLTEDKFQTTHLFNQHGIKTADYQLCHQGNMAAVKRVLKSWGGRAVYKPTSGWGGQGIIKIESEAAVGSLLQMLSDTNTDHCYLERFIDSDRTDYRIDVVDGQMVGCYGRKAPPNEWKTNVTNGGSIMLREANDQVVNLATRAAILSGLDIAGVDLIYDREHQQYVVLEVNGIPAFATPEQESIGLDFNAFKIDKMVELIERKIQGNHYDCVFNQKVA